MLNEKPLVIGMAELGVVKYPRSITTLGLGSCVGVTLYDQVNRIGGMVHVVLPEAKAGTITNRAKFASTGVDLLLDMMIRNGAKRQNIVAKLAGGAHMFSSMGQNTDFMKVGERNAAQCISALLRLRIPIVSRDLGGTNGRTIILDTEKGGLIVRKIGQGERTI